MKSIPSPVRLRPESAVGTASVERLYDGVFGRSRFEKASQGFREGMAPLSPYCWTANEGDRTIGAIRIWSIELGDSAEPALLLGPLAVAGDWTARGVGAALMTKTLGLAAQDGHDLVLLVGDPDYYHRFGFVPVTHWGFVMPRQLRPERLQAISLRHRPLEGRGGMIHLIRDTSPARAY
jgi:predicted N-acetyltransferase YhbS